MRFTSLQIFFIKLYIVDFNFFYARFISTVRWVYFQSQAFTFHGELQL
jgi:hypothetical protein